MKKHNRNIYDEIYNIKRNENKKNILSKKKKIFIAFFLIILIIFLAKIYIYKTKEDKIEKYISFTKTNKEIEKELKKDLKVRLKSLAKQEQLSERQIKEQAFINTNKSKKEETEENKEKEEKQTKIYKKAITINPKTYKVGKLNFVKYEYRTCRNNIKEEEIKIYTLKEIDSNSNKDNKEYIRLNYKDFFNLNDENLNKMYGLIEKTFNDFLKDERHKYNFDLILQNENEEEIIKNISNNIKDKTLLDKTYYYLDEEGFHIYLINKTLMHKYKQDEVLRNINIEKDKDKAKEESLVIDQVDFKFLISPDDSYIFLKDEFKNDYLKILEAYKQKLENKRLEKEREKEEQIRKAKEERKEFLKDKKYIALTFDDGPGEHTLYFLNKLKEKNVKVSFFLLGQKIPGKEYVVQRMIEDGHDVGNHSYTHPEFNKLPVDRVLQEIHMTDEAVKSATKGFVPHYLRPPYGARNKEAERVSNKDIILWNYDPLDWKYRDVARVKEEIMKMPENALPVMHDIHKTTVDAVIESIDAKREAGFEFVTVTELLEKVS